MSVLHDGTHYRACNLCEAICGLAITVEAGRIIDLRGDSLDPLSHGAICPKGSALIDLHQDPDRLTRPMRREGTRWETIGWDDAFELVASRLGAIRGTYGNDAVATYQGNPTVHNSGTLLGSGGLLRALGTHNRFSATSVDQLPHHVAALHMFGHPLLLPIPDLDRTDYFLVMGANPLVSNGSIMTAPGVRERLLALRARAGRLVTIDPRLTETALRADEHYSIRPGTDALLLLALIDVVFETGKADLARLAPFTDGIEALRDAAASFSPERVAAHTGIAASAIRHIAQEFANAKRAVAYGRMGLSTQAFGGLCQWLVNALNAITGNLDEPGGALFPQPAFDLLQGAAKGATHAGRWSSRVRSLPEFNGELPVAALAEEILEPGDGQVRALVTIAGNPVLSTPDGLRLDRALTQLDFMVSVDPYLNETTRHAHLILPPTTSFESEHYDVIFHHFAVRNTARWNAPIANVDEHQRHDWEIFAALAMGLTGKPQPTPRERIDLGLQHGVYRTSIAQLQTQPHGTDFGALAPSLPARLLTSDGRLQLAPSTFVADIARLEATLEAPRSELLLIGRRQLRSNNSWMHNAPRLMRGADRCTLMMHAEDARGRGLEHGQMVEIRSRVGAVRVPLDVTDAIMPGVVSLPHGFGHTREGVRMQVASAHPGMSLNDLTDSASLDALTGNAVLNGVPVDVRAAS